MPFPGLRQRGYTMIELLVVLSIVGVLAMMAVASIRPSQSDAVRSIMITLEGQLANAQNASNMTTQDVYIAAQGDWTGAAGDVLTIDARTMGPGAANPPGTTDITPLSATRNGSTSECFTSLYSQNVRDHVNAGIDTSTWCATALGAAPTLQSLSFFSTNTAFLAAMNNPLCQGPNLSWVVLSGISHTFLTGFCIVVVGLRNGHPVVSGPIGMIVVPAGSANIYKYYKPNNSSVWGRM